MHVYQLVLLGTNTYLCEYKIINQQHENDSKGPFIAYHSTTVEASTQRHLMFFFSSLSVTLNRKEITVPENKQQHRGVNNGKNNRNELNRIQNLLVVNSFLVGIMEILWQILVVGQKRSNFKIASTKTHIIKRTIWTTTIGSAIKRFFNQCLFREW